MQMLISESININSNRYTLTLLSTFLEVVLMHRYITNSGEQSLS